VMPTHPAVVRAELRHADVVSVHTPMLETALVGALAMRRSVPVVITHHGDLVLPPGRWSQFVERAVHRLHRSGARRAARVITYSDGYTHHSTYVRGVEDRTVAITPPITVATPRPAGVAGRRRTLAAGSGPLIGFVGRFVREKRPDVAIAAMDTVLASFPDARLVFVGEHQIRYEDTWERLAPLVERHRDHLTFLGLLTDDQELADLYAAFDVLVLTSDTECFGLVQVEAMLCGTPVVMTDIPGGREPVARTGMGRLATAGDPVSVGTAIVEVLHHADRYARSRHQIDDALGLHATLDRYEEVLLDAARRGRPVSG
jgi:glycosyltransferase involved in cell wall biosynthesis